MYMFPNIDPVAINIGSFKIYWYGITYLVGFLIAYAVAIARGKSLQGWNASQVADLLFYFALGVIFGGRIGYVILYQPITIIEDPLAALAFWERGRSFHGGLLGVLVALAVFCRVYQRKFLAVTDFIAPVIPIGLGCGRIGNFINGELWGRVTDVPWGMVFPHVDYQMRHPSQLYELCLEGILLGLILLWYASKPRPVGIVSGLFLLLYGVLRCIVELVREPDYSHGFIAFEWLTMGQLLSIPMILSGILLVGYGKLEKKR